MGRQLADMTVAARNNPNLKRNVPHTSIGGPFRPCGATPCVNAARHAEQGRPTVACTALGYRNTAHIDWDRRTGMVLLDIDDITPDDAGALRQYLRRQPEVGYCHQSISGGGLKVGVYVSPIPMTPTGGKPAWAAAAFRFQPLVQRLGGKLDPTHAAAHASILAHDPRGWAREHAGVAVHWATAPAGTKIVESHGVYYVPPSDPISHGLGLPPVDRDALAHAGSLLEIVGVYSWGEGQRTGNLYRLGCEAARRGYDWDAVANVARLVAERTGAAAKYGISECLRHVQSGFRDGPKPSPEQAERRAILHIDEPVTTTTTPRWTPPPFRVRKGDDK